MRTSLAIGLAAALSATVACSADGAPATTASGASDGGGGGGNGEVHDPDTANVVAVDRFSKGVGTLFVRTADNGLPAANVPIDFDQGPFITQGFGPQGEVTRYYNFDVQPLTPAAIYMLFREGDDSPVEGQLNILGAIPGDAGYNDFLSVTKVTVPADYVANTLASAAAVTTSGYALETTDVLLNCPVVPEGSTATLRLADEPSETVRGWYDDQVVHCLSFEEAPLKAKAGAVPTSPIFVTFNVNPDQPSGGPPSGFVVEPGSKQTHNVLATKPGDAGYSPLWSVNAYDNADFAKVKNLASAAASKVLGAGVAIVNCPVVSVE